MSRIASFLNGKTFLITGSTGFLAKGVLEKILREAPDARRIYLLIRSKRLKDGSVLTADERLKTEVLMSSLFNRLREIHGAQFSAFADSRIKAVAGDLTLDHLGMEPQVYEQLTEEVQIVINSAASVTFDEEIDAALQLNTLGARRALEFARNCRDAVLIHVSTAYVNGQLTGDIPETPPEPNRSKAQEIGLNDTPFDLDQEIKDIMSLSRQIHEQSQSPEQLEIFRRTALRQHANPGRKWLDAQMETYRKRWIKERLIEEGINRGKQWGWHDSYTLTKAMGEQLIVLHRGELPVAIVRPSIVESSLADPEPGWIEGLKVADPLIDAISRGRLPDFPADPDVALDVVPVDIVVHTVVSVIPETIQKKGVTVYQVATGDKNPIRFHEIFDLVYAYFLRNPRLNKRNQPIPVSRWTYPTLQAFQRKYRLRYILPVDMALYALERFTGISSVNRWRQTLQVVRSATMRMLYYATIYSPYTTLNCRFKTDRIQEIHDRLDPEDKNAFNLDVTRIDWKTYIQDIHIPGLKRHVLKTEAPERDKSEEEEVVERSGFEIKTEEPLPPLDTLADILAKSAEAYENKTALQMKVGETWMRYTYRQVYDMAGRIGWRWRQQGLRPGDRVLLFSENKPEWGIAYFAAMAAGAAVVPVDRQTPVSEIWSLTRFTGAKAVLCSQSGYAILRESGETPQHIPVWDIDRYGLPAEAADEAPDMESGEPPVWATVSPDSVASIIFTKGTAVDPRGVVLTHGNFVANLRSLAETLRAYHTDHFLSVLPLNHALEFTGGFLMPFYAGATITYADTLKSRVLFDLMDEAEITCILAAPRIFKLLIERFRRVRQDADPRILERLRLLVSGGSGLDPSLYYAYQEIGLTIHEGYGLTETAPILTVSPLNQTRAGSVGKPLPDIDLRIHVPDDTGQGEIITRGKNVMTGYFRNPSATEEYIRDGWLYTGDLGRIDEDGYVYITGRSKDLIVTGAGKNVYPDEVEWHFQNLPHVREMRVVGVCPPDTTGEDVHAVIVPDTDIFSGAQEKMKTHILREVQRISRTLPSYQRIQQIHLWDGPTPENGDPRQRRRQYRQAILERMTSRADTRKDAPSDAPPDWRHIVYRLISQLSHRPVQELSEDTPLESLMDSLMRIELMAALETVFKTTIPDAAALRIHTIQDVIHVIQNYAGNLGQIDVSQPVDTSDYWTNKLRQSQTAEPLPPLTPLQRLAQNGFWLSGSLFYRFYLRLDCSGYEHIPDTPFIIAANHCSHLDSGAIIVALRGRVARVHPLGARDYFFNTPRKAWFFRTMMNVIPFDRQENILEGLQAASQTLAPGCPLLIYPEGTRSLTGALQPFKIGLGLLALELNVPIVPAHISGTYAAWPKGNAFPHAGRVRVRFGPPVLMTSFNARKGHETHYDLYRSIVHQTQTAIERLRDSHEN